MKQMVVRAAIFGHGGGKGGVGLAATTALATVMGLCRMAANELASMMTGWRPIGTNAQVWMARIPTI